MDKEHRALLFLQVRVSHQLVYLLLLLNLQPRLHLLSDGVGLVKMEAVKLALFIY